MSISDFAIQLISSAAVSASLGGLIIFLTKSWISERLKNSIKNEYDEKLETHKAQLKAQADIESERLRAQLSIAATEHQMDFSSRVWLLQKQWGIREQKYAELLQQLTKFRMAIHGQDEYFMEPYDDHDQKFMRSVSENGKFQKLGTVIIEADEALRELVGPASIFLSDKTIAALSEMHIKKYEIANFSATHLGEYVAETRKVVDAAYEAVLQEARSELAHHHFATRVPPPT
jgi:hypothetical protein